MKSNYNNNGNIAKLIMMIVILGATALILLPLFQKTTNETDDISKIEIGDNMELIFFGLGEADSALIRDKEGVILIDTGEVHHGKVIVNTLKKLGVEKIDYLILTHPDKDHIGGAYEIINNIEVDRIIQTSFKKGSALQESLNSLIKEKDIEEIIPEGSLEFNLNNIMVTIFPPEEVSYKKDNNYSLLTLISHEELKFFFGGDAEKKRLEEAMTYNLPRVTLYKVPHHGRSNSKSTEMIEVLSPKYSIITSDKAEDIIEDALKAEGSEIIYTADKSIRFLSNGKELILP